MQTLSHSSLPRTFLRSLALAQCPRFQLMRHCRLLHIVWCNLMLPHNYRSRSSSLLYLLEQSFGPPQPCSSVSAISAGFTCFTPPPPGLEQPVPLPELAAYSHLLTMLAALLPYSAVACQYHTRGNTPRTPCRAKRSASAAPRGESTTLLAPIFVQMQASSPNQRQ